MRLPSTPGMYSIIPGSKFCAECGRPVAASPPPRSYTPKHLAEKILASKSALEGERKQVTVLFADVKILADGVHRFEGTVPGGGHAIL